MMVITFLLASATYAQTAANPSESKNPRTEEQIKSDSITQKTSMAMQLANEGIQNKSAAIVIAAAQLSEELGIRSVDTAKGQKYDAYSLYLAAQTFTKDKNLNTYITTQLKSIQEKNKIAGKGAAYGPLSNSGSSYFTANQRISESVYFTSGSGRVTFTGTGRTDFDLYIYDEYGNLIAKDEDYDAFCVCNFYLSYAQQITIKYVSRSTGTFNYVVTTN
jgi:hypothetical protein